MKILISIIFIHLLIFALASTPAPAEAPPPTCGLATSFFCGVWAPAGKREEAGGRVTINATAWTWENGDRADCQLLDQGIRDARHYATFRCTILWEADGQKEQQFVILYSESPFRPGEMPARYAERGGMYMSATEKLDCLMSGWEELVQSKNLEEIKFSPSSRCGEIFSYFYLR